MIDKVMFFTGYPVWLVVVGLSWAVHNIFFGRVTFADYWHVFKVIMGVK